MQLFSAPVSNKAFFSLPCMLMGKVVPVFLPNIMLKNVQNHSKCTLQKYTSGLYPRSTSSSGNCMSCIRLTSFLDISCPVMAENASAISFAEVLYSFVACLFVSCFVFELNFFHRFELYFIICLE